jgi:hypothetical protein
MILHSLSLAVESIVLGTFESRLSGARETALEGCADRWGAQLRRKALGASEHRSLREHCVVVVVQLLFGSQGTSSI